MKNDIRDLLTTLYDLDSHTLDAIVESTEASSNIGSEVRRIKQTLKANYFSRSQRSQVLKLVKNEISMNRRIDRLETMQNLFKYWHVIKFAGHD